MKLMIMRDGGKYCFAFLLLALFVSYGRTSPVGQAPVLLEKPRQVLHLERDTTFRGSFPELLFHAVDRAGRVGKTFHLYGDVKGEMAVTKLSGLLVGNGTDSRAAILTSPFDLNRNK